MRKRVSMLVLAGGVGLIAWVAANRPAPTPPNPETLTIGVSRVPHTMPMMVADAQGFFRQAGLQVVYRNYATGRDAMEALLKGEVEAATTAETPLVLHSFHRNDFRIVATLAHSYSSVKVVARRDHGIRSAADLRGRRVGVLAGTTAQFFLQTLVTDEGFAHGDVTEVELDAEQLVPHLAAGQVDAVAVFQPHIARVIAALGSEQVVIITSERTHASMNVVVQRDLPGRRPAALARLLTAAMQASAWARAHPDEAAAVVGTRVGMRVADARTALDDFHFGVILDQALVISLEEQARWAQHAGLVPRGKALPNYLELLDLSALAAVNPGAVTVIH